MNGALKNSDCLAAVEETYPLRFVIAYNFSTKFIQSQLGDTSANGCNYWIKTTICGLFHSETDAIEKLYLQVEIFKLPGLNFFNELN